MSSRMELHEKLCEILGTRHVYFQPPESVKMIYPAIVYNLDDIENDHANDGVYLSRKRYSVTAISKDPDTSLVDMLAALPLCQFSRSFKSDNLNHYVFSIYA